MDLGLPSGVKWSKYTIDSYSECEYRWGEVKAYYCSRYETYPLNHRDYKYRRNNGEYINIGTNISKTEYDVAYKRWQGDWRMPTYQDVQELIKFCKVDRVEDGKYVLVGPNGAYILLDYGPYWTASINGNGTSEKAWSFKISTEGIKLESSKRYYTVYILPVCE